MKRLVLTDTLIREALTPEPQVTAPAGLLAQITADVARTPQHRTLRLPALPRSRRLAWVLVGAATLLALARGAARRRRLTEPVRGVPAARPVAAAAAAARGDRPWGPRSRPSAPTRPGRATARRGCGTGPPPAGPDQSAVSPTGPARNQLHPRPGPHARRPPRRRRRQRAVGGERGRMDQAGDNAGLGVADGRGGGRSGRPSPRAATSISRPIARSTGAGARRRTRAPRAASSPLRPPTARSGRPASATGAGPASLA